MAYHWLGNGHHGVHRVTIPLGARTHHDGGSHRHYARLCQPPCRAVFFYHILSADLADRVMVCLCLVCQLRYSGFQPSTFFTRFLRNSFGRRIELLGGVSFWRRAIFMVCRRGGVRFVLGVVRIIFAIDEGV